MITIIEMRYMEVVVRQLPSLVKEIQELNKLLKEIHKDGTSA